MLIGMTFAIMLVIYTVMVIYTVLFNVATVNINFRQVTWMPQYEFYSSTLFINKISNLEHILALIHRLSTHFDLLSPTYTKDVPSLSTATCKRFISQIESLC